MAIDSMLNQTIKPEQYVVVEDGEISSDIEDLLAEYNKKYPALFTIVKIETNSGLANALNEGLKACRNELVARMDADDISLSLRCERELELFQNNPDLVLCGCNIIEFSGSIHNTKTSRIVPSEYKDIMKFLRRRTPFNHPTVMYKKSKVIENGGYSIEIKRKQDYDLFSRMLINGCYALNVDDALLLFRADDDNFARRKSFQTLKSAFIVYWRHFKRKGCSLFDLFIMCCGEIIFFIMPIELMKVVSNKFLRAKAC